MIIRNANFNDLSQMNLVWNEVVNESGFYKPLDANGFYNKLINNPEFNFSNVYVAVDDVIVGYAVSFFRERVKDTGYINTILVKKEYRNQGIGSKLLASCEEHIKSKGINKVVFSGFLPSCHEWYIPNTDKHDHPCCPGIRLNSPEYFFLLHHGYETFAYCDAFHLGLKDYELPESIKNILLENEKEGIKIELYDKNKHYGLEEFYQELNIYDFEKVIRENLSLENPYPFLVVSDNGKIKGWTGAMWNEASGRGHFDGIAILQSIRGKGLGKALFASLAYYSKKNGAKFMTFYTGLTNHARYIYMKAGFKIVQSFASMKKEI